MRFGDGGGVLVVVVAAARVSECEEGYHAGCDRNYTVRRTRSIS
jgi:hypothetical protein